MEFSTVRVSVQKGHLIGLRKFMAVFPEMSLGGQMVFSQEERGSSVFQAEGSLQLKPTGCKVRDLYKEEGGVY